MRNMLASFARHAHMHLQDLSFLALLPALAGCASVGMMKELPPDAGRLALYAAPPDTVAAVAEQALTRQHVTVADTSRDDGARIVIGRRAPGLFSNGEYVRVRIAPDSGGRTAVRVVARSGYLLDLGYRDRAPRVLVAMDTQLGAAALGPWPGMRVRATPHGATPIIGTVARVSVDTLVLEGVGSAPRTLKLGALDGLAVNRGSYRHTREGALIGLLVGGVIGGFIASANTDSDPWAGLNILAGISVGIGAGAVVGGAMGAGARTE